MCVCSVVEFDLQRLENVMIHTSEMIQFWMMPQSLRLQWMNVSLLSLLHPNYSMFNIKTCERNILEMHQRYSDVSKCLACRGLVHRPYVDMWQ